MSMTESELKIWFLDKLNSCYPVKMKSSNNIYWFYNNKFARRVKVNKLNNTNVNVKLPIDVNGKCLFEVDLINNYLWCDYKYIWKSIECNYDEDFYNIKKVLEDFLKDNDIIKFKIVSKIISVNLYTENFENLSVHNEDSSGRMLNSIRDIDLKLRV